MHACIWTTQATFLVFSTSQSPLKKVEGSSAVTPKVLIDHDFHRDTSKHTLSERVCSHYPIHQYRGLHGNASQAKYEQIYYSSAYYDEKNVQDLDFSFI